MTKKADRDQIRRQNRSIILQTLRRNGPLARIDLGQITRLSPATVTAITSDLLDQGLIEGLDSEEPKAPQSRGRPRSLLRLNPDAACVLGIRLSVNAIDMALANFSGETFLTRKVAFDSSTADDGNFPATLASTALAFVEEAGLSKSKIREIGVAAQGVVDLSSGCVVWSPAFQGRNIPITEPLQAAFGARCLLSNDTNMITEALHWSDPGTFSGTFAVVMLDYGVGMGLYLDNKLFAGASGKAAEFGHANHIPGGALCRCGKRGCMEAYLSDYALVRAASQLPETTDPDEIDAGVAGLTALISRAQQGDQVSLDTFAGAGRVLGYGLARLLAIIDPSRIVLTGAAMRAFAFMEQGMKEGLEEALVADLRQNFVIDVMPWEEDFIRRGLIAQAMERLDLGYSGSLKSKRTAQIKPDEEPVQIAEMRS